MKKEVEKMMLKFNELIVHRIHALEAKRAKIMEQYPESLYGIKGVLKCENIDEEIADLKKLDDLIEDAGTVKAEHKAMAKVLVDCSRMLYEAEGELRPLFETKMAERCKNMAYIAEKAAVGDYLMVEVDA